MIFVTPWSAWQCRYLAAHDTLIAVRSQTSVGHGTAWRIGSAPESLAEYDFVKVSGGFGDFVEEPIPCRELVFLGVWRASSDTLGGKQITRSIFSQRIIVQVIFKHYRILIWDLLQMSSY